MRILSIDPGLSGAWAVIVDGRPEACGDMPVYGEGTSRRVMAAPLASYFDRYGPIDLAVIEAVHAMPKQGVSSSFRFGMAYGAVVAIVGVREVPLELVTPQVWKKAFGLRGSDKERSRQKAIDLAPHMYAMLERKRDENRAEAILIGLYGAATWDTGRIAA